MHRTAVLGLGLSLAVLVCGGAAAQDEPKAYDCVFETVTSWTFTKGAFATKPPEPLKFTITDVDLDGQSARLGTDVNGKSGSLKIVRAINANHFLEVVNEGFLNLTTVYDKDPTTGKHPAVHSRHFGVIGEPVVAQYAGFCTAK
jgi:hypothetical protein